MRETGGSAALSSDDVASAGRPARVPASVCTIEHAWIPMPDGTKLAARIWLPEDAGAAPSGGGRSAGAGQAERGGGTSRVPAILDFLPYRQGDLMAARDAAIYPYLAT